mmetsp:Transcript_131944/g.367862  ORF Transcript_131944/g.367862 Transcript_131944/m.367862 type:complete len:492 (+) Transcript_131944:545-2020(+)
MVVHRQRPQRGQGRLADGLAADLLGELPVPDHLPLILRLWLKPGLGHANAPPMLQLARALGYAPRSAPLPLQVALDRGLGLRRRQHRANRGAIFEVRGVLPVLLVCPPEEPRFAAHLYDRGRLVQDPGPVPCSLPQGSQRHLRPLPPQGELQAGIEVVTIADHRVAAIAVPALAGGAAGTDGCLEGGPVQEVPAVLEGKELALQPRVTVGLALDFVEDLVASRGHRAVCQSAHAQEMIPCLLPKRHGRVLCLLLPSRVLGDCLLVVSNEVAYGTVGHAQRAAQPSAYCTCHFFDCGPGLLQLGRAAEAWVRLLLLHGARTAIGDLLRPNLLCNVEQLHELVLHFRVVALLVVLLSRGVVTIVVPLELPLLLRGHVQEALFLLPEHLQLLRRAHGWHQRAHELLLGAVLLPKRLWMVNVELGIVTDLAPREKVLVQELILRTLRSWHLLLVVCPFCVSLLDVLLKGLILGAQPSVQLVIAGIGRHVADDPLG